MQTLALLLSRAQTTLSALGVSFSKLTSPQFPSLCELSIPVLRHCTEEMPVETVMHGDRFLHLVSAFFQCP